MQKAHSNLLNTNTYALVRKELSFFLTVTLSKVMHVEMGPTRAYFDPQKIKGLPAFDPGTF